VYIAVADAMRLELAIWTPRNSNVRPLRVVTRQAIRLSRVMDRWKENGVETAKSLLAKPLDYPVYTYTPPQ